MGVEYIRDRAITMPLSDILSGFAILVSIGALWYARLSATAAEVSARTAQDALSFQRDSYATEQSVRRKEHLSALADEALENWKIHGNLVPILDREKDLSAEDQEDLARRVYRTLGRPEKDGVDALEQWRQSRAGK